MVSRKKPPSDNPYANLAACVISLAVIELSDPELKAWAESEDGKFWARQACIQHWQLLQEVEAVIELGHRPVQIDDEL